MATSEIASESGHFYDREGNPAYTYRNKKGAEKKTTLREARKFSYVPSVTTVMNILAKPQLEKWKQNQILMAAMTLPAIKGETLDQYAVRVMKDAQEHAREARNKGTYIHGQLERYFQFKQIDEEAKPICKAVKAEVEKIFKRLPISEHSFAHPLGYGGKTDLCDQDAVVDFKTKDFGETDLQKGWPDHCYQLAAYRHGLGYNNARCYNIFVSVSNPGLVHIYKWKEEELQDGLKVFLAALELWKAIKKFDSSF